MSRFFINRPIFAWVVALLIMGAGALAVLALPIEQYPQVAPPTVEVSATYPGASAQTLENTVTQVIEQSMTGIDGLRYITSTSSSSGQATVTLTFDPGTDPDIAQVQVQNKLARATPSLPAVVQQQGLVVNQTTGSFLMVAAFYAEEGSELAQDDISDFVASTILEPVSRVDGVGQVRAFGPEHAMRIWLDPERMTRFEVTTQEILQAVQTQNAQVASGQLGGTPAVEDQQINATIISQTLLSTPQQFADILLRVEPDGSKVTIGDVARVTIGAESYGSNRRYNRRPAAGMAVNLASGANALATTEAVKERIAAFESTFPKGLKVGYPVDTTTFVRISIREVVKTLAIAVGLVVLVLFVFLQTLRATFIPAVAIPVVLLGTFGVLLALGYSINTLTLFALVLAIGLLVDDAIVVVENVERALEEDPDLTPREAARRAMDEISGALIGTTLVTCAVFVPMAFFPGSTGVIYRQFSVTVVASLALSLFVALTLSPALCGSLLKAGMREKTRGPFGWFNRGFRKLNAGYERSVAATIRHRLVSLVVFGGLVAAAAVVLLRLPSSFLPDEDQGRVYTLINGPPSATLQRTMSTVYQVEDFYLDQIGDLVDGIFTVAGFSFSGVAQNAAIGFVLLADWDERTGEGQTAADIQRRSMQVFGGLKDAQVFTLAPPPIAALGNASGFELRLVDREGLGHDALMDAMGRLLGAANQDPRLQGVRFNGLEDNPQYQVDIDEQAAEALGVSIPDVNNTLGVAWGGRYVNDYLEKGRIKRVYVQADAPFRMMPEDLDRWYVRSRRGGMVAFSDFSSGRWTYGSPSLQRFNGLPAVQIQGSPAPGRSSTEAMQAMREQVDSLPGGFDIEWTGLSYEEVQAGTQAPVLYGISLIVAFLVLAALYESWALPLAILLVVPLGILGAVLATWLTDLANDVYFQVGLLLTMGLAAKNAILIVEFAKTKHEAGEDLVAATVDAARLRLRPILMTSLTFGLGVLPLAMASGPGSGAQNSIGTGLVGGITSTTLLIIFFAPLFFVVVGKLFGGKGQEAAA